jgi:hypothetical protein
MTNIEKGDIKDNIIKFMQYYDLTDDDIAWDTLIKMYYRARFYVPAEKSAKMSKIMETQLSLFG